MSDVSNRTIVALLAVALVVSVAGTMYSVSELGALGGSYNILTGAATTDSADGTTSIELAGDAGITLNNNAVDFGSGYVDPDSSSETATIDTSGDSITVADWINTSALVHVDFHIENTGSVPLYVNMSSETNAEGFLCDEADGTACSSTSAFVEVNFEEQESSSCDGSLGNLNVATWNDLMTQSGVGTGGNPVVRVCNYLHSTNGKDTIDVDLRLTIPTDAPSGPKDVTLTVDAQDATI